MALKRIFGKQNVLDAVKQLTVMFIDYKSMLEAAYRWRKIFLSVGAKFE